MSERPRRRPPRQFYELPSTGREGKVLGYKRGQRQGDLVIKKLDADPHNQDGFSREHAELLRAHYAHLVEQYGDIIVRQKIMPTKDGHRYFLAQERLPLANPPDVLAYLPSTFPEAAKDQLRYIVEQGQLSFFDAFRATPKKFQQPVPLDLGPGNLVITHDHKVRYIDTGLAMHSYPDLAEFEAIHHEVWCRLAQLDLLRGRPVDQVVKDPLYSVVSEMARHLNPRGFKRSKQDADALKQLYDDVFQYSPLRGYLNPDHGDGV